MSPEDCRVALREGDWKIVGDVKMEKFLLFNMAEDYKEEHDLSSEHPEVLARLKAALIAHDKAAGMEQEEIVSHG